MYAFSFKNILGHELKKFKGHFNFFTEEKTRIEITKQLKNIL